MVACRYALVRYVPDPGRGEQVNVGVVVISEEATFFGAKFLPHRQASRLRALGFGVDFGFLQDLAREFDASSLHGQTRLAGLGGAWSSDAVEKAAGEWANTIQFSPLRGALHNDPDQLLSSLYARYVSPARPRPQRPERDRRWVKTRISRALRHAVVERVPDRDPDDVVQVNRRVEGKLDEHWFDYGLANGQLLRLIQTLSFELQDKAIIRREVDATAWAIEDVRRSGNKTPISVVTIGEGKLLRNAERVYGELRAELVREGEIDPWLGSVTSSLVSSLE